MWLQFTDCPLMCEEKVIKRMFQRELSVKILSLSKVRTIVVIVKQLVSLSLCTVGEWHLHDRKTVLQSRVQTKCATYRSTMSTPRDSNNHHPKLLSTPFLVKTLYEVGSITSVFPQFYVNVSCASVFFSVPCLSPRHVSVIHTVIGRDTLLCAWKLRSGHP